MIWNPSICCLFCGVCSKSYNLHYRFAWLYYYRVVAVFGSSPSNLDSSVASVCSALHVPYLTASSHPVMAGSSSGNVDNLASSSSRKFAVHLGPSQNDLIQAVKETIDQLKWTEVALLSHRETGKKEIWIRMLLCNIIRFITLCLY